MFSRKSKIPPNIKVARESLELISFALRDFPRDVVLPDTTETFRKCSRNRPGRDSGDINLGGIALQDGIAIAYTTSGFLVDYSHRFTFPDDGDQVRYHRDAFNVDAQCLPPPSIELTGIENIANRPEALEQLRNVVDFALRASIEGWSEERVRVRMIAC